MALGPTDETFGSKPSPRPARRRRSFGTSAAAGPSKLRGEVAPHVDGNVKWSSPKGKARAAGLEQQDESPTKLQEEDEGVGQRKQRRLKKVATGMGPETRWKGGLRSLVEEEQPAPVEKSKPSPSKPVKSIAPRFSAAGLVALASASDAGPKSRAAAPPRPDAIPSTSRDVVSRAPDPCIVADLVAKAEPGRATKPLGNLAVPSVPQPMMARISPLKRPTDGPNAKGLATAPAFDLTLLIPTDDSAPDGVASLTSPPKKRRTNVSSKTGLLPFGLAERAQAVVERQKSGWGMWRSDVARTGLGSAAAAAAEEEDGMVLLRIENVEGKVDFGKVVVAQCRVLGSDGRPSGGGSSGQSGRVVFSLHLASLSSTVRTSFDEKDLSTQRGDRTSMPDEPLAAPRRPVSTPFELAKEVKPGRTVWGAEPWTVVELDGAQEDGQGGKALILTRFGVWR